MAAKRKEYRVSYNQWNEVRQCWNDCSHYRNAASPEAAARSVARDNELEDDTTLVVEEIGKTLYFTTTSKTTYSAVPAE